MKILTLNTHSLSEEEMDKKRYETALFISKEKPDVIALQEVNQTLNAEKINVDDFYKGQSQIKKDNYAYALVCDIKAFGLDYYWTWLPIKLGFGRFEEGLALLSLQPIDEIEDILLTKVNDFSNWKTRKAIGIRTIINNQPCCIYTTHMGWWQDDEEPFLYQWNQLSKHLSNKEEIIYIAGDFNAPDALKGESYDTVQASGWYDVYQLAQEKIGHDTAKGKIDGWEKSQNHGMRIDYIFTNRQQWIKKCEVVFDGTKTPIVSDHYGILMEE